jgi:hypothetical protein
MQGPTKLSNMDKFKSKFYKTTHILTKLSQNYKFKYLYHKTTDLTSHSITKLHI